MSSADESRRDVVAAIVLLGAFVAGLCAETHTKTPRPSKIPHRTSSQSRTSSQPQSLPQSRSRAPGRFRVDARDSEIRGLLETLAREAQRNLIVDAEVEGRLTLQLRDVPFSVALASICRQVDCVARKECGVLWVSPVIRVSVQGSANLRMMLSCLAAHGRRSLVCMPEVGGSTTLAIRDLPWDQALELILEKEGLQARTDGRLIIVSVDELGWGEPFRAMTPETATREALE